jgi:RNA polymerase sigma-70 factor (ECF subfamily)
VRLSQPSVDQPFEVELLGLLPHVRAFSIQLCGRSLGEDIAQETLTKAWKARSSYLPGSNMKAWLFTILRNEYISHQRRAWRQVSWDQDVMDKVAAPPLQQKCEIELLDLRRALLRLPAHQREALLLITASGFSYQQASSITATPTGTLKSRVSRARAKLLDLLDGVSVAAPGAPKGRAVATANL